MNSVPEVAADDGRELIESWHPFVIRKYCENWPCLKRWDMNTEYLQSRVGAAHVDVAASATQELRGGIGGHPVETMSFAGFLSAASTSAAEPSSPDKYLYLGQSPLFSHGSPSACPLAPLMADVHMPRELLGDSRVEQVSLWINGAPMHAAIHYDGYQGLLCVLRGRKTAYLLPPAAAPLVRGGSLASDNANQAALPLVELLQVARDRPAVAATVWRTELAPGDALFIPEGWYHGVESAALTMAVNFWWDGWARMLNANRAMATYFARRSLAALVDDKRDLRTPSNESGERAQPSVLGKRKADIANDAATAQTNGDAAGLGLFTELLRAQAAGELPAVLRATACDRVLNAMQEACGRVPRSVLRFVLDLSPEAADVVGSVLDWGDSARGEDGMSELYRALFSVIPQDKFVAVVRKRRQIHVRSVLEQVLREVAGENVDIRKENPQ